MADEADKDAVVVIDTDARRANNMVKAFKQLGCRVCRFGRDGNDFRAEPADDYPTTCLVLLWHFGDVPDVNEKFKWPEVKATRTVYYGGRGGGDDRCPPNAQERIWRRVGVDPDSALSVEEATELLVYVKTLAGGKENVARPAFLEQPHQTPLLRSLAQLCKGYLAVHKAVAAALPPEQLDFVPASIEKALRDMGWDKLPADLKRAYSAPMGGIRDCLPLVRNPDWWRRPLLEDTRGRAGLGSFQVPRLKSALTEEWQQLCKKDVPAAKGKSSSVAPEPDTAVATGSEDRLKPVTDLVDRIGSEGDILPPEVVGKAYEALDWVLTPGGRV